MTNITDMIKTVVTCIRGMVSKIRFTKNNSEILCRCIWRDILAQIKCRKNALKLVAGQPTIARLKVTKADMLWGTAADEYVSLVARCTVDGRTVTKTTLVRVSTRTHSVFVQTDKPIYTPRQRGEWI